MAAKFVVYLDTKKKFRFRLLASNGEVVASGQAYETKASCMNGVKSIQKNAAAAAIVDETVKKEPAAKKPAAKAKTVAKPAAAKKAPVKRAPAKKAAAEAPAPAAEKALDTQA